MTQEWELTAPHVLDVGADGERVQRLTVCLVGGRVDVLTHDDSAAAHVEVGEVQGPPLRVRWNGSHLEVTQRSAAQGSGFFDRARAMFDGLDRNQVVVSISVPRDTTVSVSTVNANVLLTGLRNGAKTNTVSGLTALDDIVGATEVNTVSGDVEIQGVRGRLAVNSVSAAVTARDCELPEIKINTVSGDIALDMTNAAATIGSNSVSGDITVRSPHVGYDIIANTVGGQVVIDGQSIGSGPRRRHSRVIEGNGDLRVKANAISGHIVVLRPQAPVQAAVAP